jgi:hypothetical protein
MGMVRFAFTFVRLGEMCSRGARSGETCSPKSMRGGWGERIAFAVAFHARGRTCSALPWGRNMLRLSLL